jgi:RHS repeat-associated protein
MRYGTALLAALVLILGGVTPAHAQSEVVEYYALDAIGSVRVVFDVNGNVIGRMDYDPFGAPLSSGNGLPSRAYAGLFRDGEAGLDHAQARSYQVRTGRFSTVDPIYAGLFEPQAWNRYAYALNSPILVTDTSGSLAQGPPSLSSSFCGAEHRFGDCGGNDYFWGNGDANGFGFGGGIAEARRQGYVEGMPTEVWSALQAFNQRAQTAFAEAQQAQRESRPVVDTSYDIKLEDGTFVGTSDPLRLLAKDIVNRTEVLTRPTVYGEFLVVSAAGGVGGRVLWGTLAGTIRFHGPDEGGRIGAVSVRGVQVVRFDYAPIPGSQHQPVLHVHLEPFGMKTHIPLWPPGRPR